MLDGLYPDILTYFAHYFRGKQAGLELSRHLGTVLQAPSSVAKSPTLH